MPMSLEIPPGGSLKPQRMMYEESIFVVEGNGSTRVWNDENKKVTSNGDREPVLAAAQYLATAFQRAAATSRRAFWS